MIVLLLLTLLHSTMAFDPNDYISIPYLKFPHSLTYNVLLIENWTDYFFTTLYVGVFYYSLYVGICEIFVRTHPAPKTPERVAGTAEERRRGFKALLGVIMLTTLIIWKLVPRSPYYGYYETHDFGIKEFLIQLVVYMFAFDLWFFCTHLIGHSPFFWKHFHAEHHEFIEVGAYGQDAVHPVEALVQGPIGHYLSFFLFPMHPAAHTFFGLMTSIYAQFAHDGRWDPAGHHLHHYYHSSNYSIWGFSDIIFGTRFKPENYPFKYVQSWLRKDEKKIE